MPITHVRKRTGDLIPFDRNKILQAIEKAFVAVDGVVDMTEADRVCDAVVEQLYEGFDGVAVTPTVEEVQDMVEQKLAEMGHFDVAKDYILYRAARAQERAEERIKNMEQRQLKVTKADGSTETFSLAKLRKCVKRHTKPFKNVKVEEILEGAKGNIFDGIKTADIQTALAMTCKSRIEKEPQYSYVAASFLLDRHYNEVFPKKITPENFDAQYRSCFKGNMQRGVDAKRIDKRLMEFDYDRIEKELKPERDQLLQYLGAQTIYDRYVAHINGDRLEAPQHFWMRVGMGLALAEKKEERTDYALKFYSVLSTLRFICSTPTLFNSGTTYPQLSSCYLSTIEDDLSHIFKVVGDNAQLSKYSGGIGNDWTNVRAIGSYIQGTNQHSSGIIPFLKIMNDTTIAINRAGKRRGATVAYLETWHYEIEEFLDLRKNTGDDRRRTHDMNTANWIPDLFMKRVREGGEWTLFDPHEVKELHHIYGTAFEEKYIEYEKKAAEGKITVTKTIKAAALWRKMITMLFETGHPWITFKDPCNVRSPQDHVGVVHNSNLCTEITLNNSAEETAVCNLGSVNLPKHFDAKTKGLDHAKLKETIHIGMRMLDNVVDLCFYPTPETKYSNLKHRPVGMGVMGYQDLIYLMNLQFDSDAAVEFSDAMMEEIAYNAYMESSILAKDKGAYSTFKGSKWDRDLLPHDTLKLLEDARGMKLPYTKEGQLDWSVVRDHIQKYGMRNSNCLAIAPTASIGNIAGSTPCIEPIYKNIYVKSNMGGEFTVVNGYLVEDLKKLGLWSGEMLKQLKIHDGSIQEIDEIPKEVRAKYKEVFEIDAKWVVRHAAARGKWIDQSQSVNLFYRGTSGKDIADIYMYAWEMGLKTTYYLRTLGASQIEKATVSIKAETQSRDFSKKPESATEKDKAVMCSILNGPDCEACQ